MPTPNRVPALLVAGKSPRSAFSRRASFCLLPAAGGSFRGLRLNRVSSVRAGGTDPYRRAIVGCVVSIHKRDLAPRYLDMTSRTIFRALMFQDCLDSPMLEWKYRKIDLNDPPREATDLDLLDKAGSDGWELVVITVNSIAYLKRATTKT